MKKTEIIIKELSIHDNEQFKVDLLFNSASSQAFDKATKFASMIDSLTSVDYNEDKLVFQLKSDPEQPLKIGEFIQANIFGGFSFIVLNKHTNRPTLFIWTCQNGTLEHGSYLPDQHAPILHCYCQVYNFPLPYIEITEVQEHE